MITRRPQHIISRRQCGLKTACESLPCRREHIYVLEMLPRYSNTRAETQLQACTNEEFALPWHMKLTISQCANHRFGEVFKHGTNGNGGSTYNMYACICLLSQSALVHKAHRNISYRYYCITSASGTWRVFLFFFMRHTCTTCHAIPIVDFVGHFERYTQRSILSSVTYVLNLFVDNLRGLSRSSHRRDPVGQTF